MTVTYTPVVANASFFCMFWKVMKIYRGSIYKIVWQDLLFFIAIFLTFQFVTLFVFSESQQLAFKPIRDKFYIKRENIPLHFVLGFFVLLVVDRWRFLHLSVPSADTFSMLLNTAISDNSEKSRLMRRAAVRYMIVSYIINLRTLSSKMRKRFPTLQSVVNLGILLKNEEEILEKIEDQTLVTSYVIPLVWATNIINRARKEGLINNDCIVQDLLTELGNYRRKLGDLISYDLVCIPLFYIQVVTLTIYSYFFTTIIGYQVCRDEGVSIVEIAVSLISASLEFTFLVGWVKVAEVLINPFGEDDEDFEVDISVDRNLKAANMIVDYMRVNESDNHFYDYPVFGHTPNEGQALYEEIDESKNLTENHLYCSIEKSNNLEENPLYCSIEESNNLRENHLYCSIEKSNNLEENPLYCSIEEINNLTENHLYCSIEKSNNVKENPLYCSIEEEAGTQTEDKYFQIYENVPVTSAPLQLQHPAQSRACADYVNVINKSIPTDEVSFESNARNLEETHIYENIPIAPAPLHIKNQSQSSSYVDNVNVIYKNMPTDEVNSSDSDDYDQKKTAVYENVLVAPASSQQQTLFQSSSNVDYANVNCNRISPDAVISIGPDAMPLLKLDAYENTTPKPKKSSNKFSFAKLKFYRKK